MTKRALLILIGGRQIPNLLSAAYLKPDIIVPIASHEALKAGQVWSTIENVLQQICPEGLEKPISVDAFDLQQTSSACEDAIRKYPDAQWFFNITCATTIMSIGAYEVAKQHNLSSWYLNTATRQVVTLSGNPPIDNIYNLSVMDYMQAYGRYPQATKPNLPSQRLIDFAKYLAQQPETTIKFRDRLRTAKANVGKYEQSRTIQLNNLNPDMQNMCKEAHNAEMISSYTIDSHQVVTCELPGGQLWEFMDGLWLEVYTWHEAQASSCFDDCRYALRIPNQPGKQDTSVATNELDLAATYAASLLIAECKTEKDPFATEHLDQLRAIASMVGGNFVVCLFIVAQFASKHERAFESFENQAKARRIVVVTGEELGQLSSIFKREVQRSTYPVG